MLAFELPPVDSMSVEYYGLSQQADISERQKDLLRQALGELLPGTKEFFDASEAPEVAQRTEI